MTTPAPVCADALSDKELEILRMLAGGHTVKSIAARLGRSEASVNERLREARRKTGVGSSRELARLLDTQKIWDRKIDLSSAASPSDDQHRPQERGRWSKGKMMLLIALPLTAAAALLVTTKAPEYGIAPVAMTAAADSPLVGRWSLDVAKIPENERPRAVTIAFEPASEGRLYTVVTIVSSTGAEQVAKSTAALDGVAVPVTGSMAFIDTVSLRQPQPDTLVMTLAKGGQRVSTRVYSVAKDGRSMTETIVWANGEMPEPRTTIFNRMS